MYLIRERDEGTTKRTRMETATRIKTTSSGRGNGDEDKDESLEGETEVTPEIQPTEVQFEGKKADMKKAAQFRKEHAQKKTRSKSRSKSRSPRIDTGDSPAPLVIRLAVRWFLAMYLIVFSPSILTPPSSPPFRIISANFR